MATTRLEPGLYAITDPDLLPGDRLFNGVEAALRGGAVLVQYRDKQAPAELRRERAIKLLAICRHHNRPLIINDDPLLALQIGADGVHMGQEDGSLEDARRLLGPAKLLGATCHGSLALAQRAASADVDYLAFGRFFTSRTKGQAPEASLSVLTEARALALPTTAIGGITLDNTEAVVTAGADLVAVVHGLFSATDIEARARQFTHLIQDVREQSA